MASTTPALGRSGPSASNVTAALDRGKLTLLAVISLAATGAAPLTVIAGGATTGWLVTGVLGIPVAYAAIMIPLWLFSVGYTQMSRRIVNPGAFYSYIAQGLGRIPGVGAAAVALLGYNAMQIGLYGGFGAVLSGFLASRFSVHIAWGWLAAGAWLLIAILGVRRIAFVGKVLTVLLYAEIVIAIVYAVVELAHPAGGRLDTATLNPANLWGAGAGAALVTAITGYVGFEATAVYSREAKNPARNIPRATYLSLLVIGVLYTVCSWAMAVAAGSSTLIKQATDNGSELMFVLAGKHLAQIWIDCGHILFCSSLFAALLAFHTTASRYGYALGKERILPKWMGSMSRTTGAPLAGSLTQSALAIVVILTYVIEGWDPMTKLFFWVTVLGGLGVLILMAFASVAVIAYFKRQPARELSAWQRWIAPLLGAVTLGWVLWETVAQFDVLLGVQPDDSTRWVLPGLYLAAAVIGVLWAVVLNATRPDIYAGIGRSVSAERTDTTGPLGTPFPAAGGAA
ncbi:MAG: amino acid permease-associated region [Mycobacterium sp.]|nr:amino acid permease-associated region [Mycobacterium sp.]